MKKSLIIFLLILFCLSFISAAIPNPEEVLGFDPNDISIDSEDAKNVAQDYLEDEWDKILENKGFGKIVLFIGDFLKYLNPVFKVILGVEYSLSWMFFLSLGAWIYVFLMVFYAVKAIFASSEIVNFGVGVFVSILLAQFKLFSKFIELISPLLKDNLRIVIAIVVVSFILYWYVYLMERFEKYTKKTIKKEAEEQKEMKEKLKEK